jgi:hypothetical protein
MNFHDRREMMEFWRCVRMMIDECQMNWRGGIKCKSINTNKHQNSREGGNKHP